MIKKSFEFDTLFSDIEQRLEERKNGIKPIRFKTCSKCKQKKSIFKFSLDKRNINGRTGICKACRSLEYLKYYYQNRERILIQVKEYQDEKDRSKYFKDYRRDHKEQLRKQAGNWYKKNRKRIKKRDFERKAKAKKGG
ncbi:hypothetical protein ES705_50720 [subsurface metagenome]